MTRTTRIALGSSLLVGLVVGGLWLSASGCQVNTQVTEPYRERKLAADEIRSMLRSDDFKQRVEASKQIDSLAGEDKLAVLLDLARDPDAATRLLAVKKLKGVDDPRARQALADLGKNDPDPTVRDLAGA
jgi:hypothetical protein